MKYIIISVTLRFGPSSWNLQQIVFAFCSNIQQQTLAVACRLRHVCSRMFTLVMRTLIRGPPLKVDPQTTVQQSVLYSCYLLKLEFLKMGSHTSMLYLQTRLN